ncbi:Uncharacterised protein [Mycobacteroides abscessus subsp. abscessus]|nr:Uncharacterised protein [Mycobacteroides abscessus subsp. abscessus]
MCSLGCWTCTTSGMRPLICVIAVSTSAGLVAMSERPSLTFSAWLL